MIFRLFDEEEHEEIFKRVQEGGVLFLIERTDTNEFCYHERFCLVKSHDPPPKTKWDARVDCLLGTEMFLTKEDAEKHKDGFREGGCERCGNGSREIPTIVSEHEFVPSTNIKNEKNEKRKET